LILDLAESSAGLMPEIDLSLRLSPDEARGVARMCIDTGYNAAHVGNVPRTLTRPILGALGDNVAQDRRLRRPTDFGKIQWSWRSVSLNKWRSNEKLTKVR
jgi:hypothetical protein